ncbi:DHH family phosphoesterase [Mycoplasmopsis columboralis]|uniref:Putative bifunctional signaling protein/50S ribosomal protein L9 n=1 Tax=Mycoplasmopsis columboralis TaxID=171282 RepID=A0A449B6J5_9BACT|nr:DHH family phosphoesterase [Mycoplasmopsis columboralis]VEU76182.1 putative bifunctional signaling protein/50S ribosomal protein L9 [Mycoplasmopsis columboralis]
MKNRNKIILTAVIFVLFSLSFIGLLIPLVIYRDNTYVLFGLLLGILTVLSVEAAVLYFLISRFVKSRELIRKSFNSFIEDTMANNNIGIIIYDSGQEIVWSSSFLKSKFKNDFIGWTVEDFFNKFHKDRKKIDLNENRIEFSDSNNIYEAQFWPISSTIVIRDISTEHLFKTEAWEQKPVIGEIEIDNFQLYQSILSEEQFFRINKAVIDTIEDYVKKYNIIYRQYTNGKFIIFANEKTLSQLKQEHFDLFMKLNQRDIADVNKLSLSMGFASGWSSLKEQLEQAKKALLQAQSRGGDQVAIFSNTHNPIYFGSNSEIVADNSRTKVKNIALEMKKKLLSDEIDKVIIYGHSIADLDAIGAAYGIYEIAKSFNKKAYIGNITFDNTASLMMNEMKQVLSEPYSVKTMDVLTKMTNEKTMVVFVDNSDVARTDNPHALVNTDRNNVFVLDHHRVGKSVDYCPRTNVYIDTTASSASEIVTEIISFIENKVNISTTAAQLLLNGIYLDTSQFSKSVSQRAFAAAGYLESKGARGSVAGEILKIDNKTRETVENILKNLTEVKPGFFLAYSNIEASNDTISIAANEVLKIKGRVASFVVAKLKESKVPNTYKLSARGINTNVQIICESVGGGGHFGVAAAVSQEELSVFVDNIRHAIIMTGERKNESNFN